MAPRATRPDLADERMALIADRVPSSNLPVARLIISTDDDAAYPGTQRRQHHFGTGP
jgi:hypothetical protein